MAKTNALLYRFQSGTLIDVIVGEFGYSYLEHSQASTARALNILILYYNLARRSKAIVKKGGQKPPFPHFVTPFSRVNAAARIVPSYTYRWDGPIAEVTAGSGSSQRDCPSVSNPKRPAVLLIAGRGKECSR